MKQVVAALAVLAALLALVVVLTGGEEDEAATAATTNAQTGDADARTAGAAGDAAGGGEDDGKDAVTGDARDATILPGFDVVRVEPDGAAVMAGTAEPGAEVSVVTRNGVIGRTVADDRGEWVLVLEEPLKPGDHEIWIEARSGDGGIVKSAEAVVVSIPEAGEDVGDGAVALAEAGTADSADAGSAANAGALAVVVPRDGEAGVEVLQAPGDGVGISGGGALTLESLSYDEEGGVALSGKAEPGGVVIAYVDGAAAGEAVADAEGNWALALDAPLEPGGQYDLRVDQLDATGVVVARLEMPFRRAAFAMPAADEPLVVIQPGNNLWVIARRVYGKGVLYTQIFEANRGQIADPDLIYPGQIFILPEAGPPEG